MEFKVLFGPAYKGIPLVTAVSMELTKATDCGILGGLQKEFPVAYDRSRRRRFVGRGSC